MSTAATPPGGLRRRKRGHILNGIQPVRKLANDERRLIMSKPIYVSDETFETEVLQSETPVLVDFYADWCGPCRVISPMLEEIAEEVDGEFRVAKLDIDANSVTTYKYGVQSIPTLILFKDGRPVERWVGIVPKQLVLSQARDHLSAVVAIQN